MKPKVGGMSCQALPRRGTSLSTSRPTVKIHKQVVRKAGRGPQHRTRPGHAPPLHRSGGNRTCTTPPATWNAWKRRWKQQWGLRRPGPRTCASCSPMQTALREGDWKVTVAVHRAQVITAIWPGFIDRAYGLGGGRGLDHHCRPPLRTWRPVAVIASSGIMNPQIRFGEDLMSRVSYVMMNPGRRQAEMTDAVREAINTLAGGGLRRRAGIKRERDPECHLRRQPHHASPAAGHRSDRSWGGAPFALAANSGITALGGSQLDLRVPSRCAGLRTALHRGACGRRHRGRDPFRGPALERRNHPGGGCRHQRRNRTRQQGPAPRLFFAHRACFRGCPDLLRPARRAWRHRTLAHRPRDARAALQGHWLRPLVGRRGLRRSDKVDRRHGRLRIGHHRGFGGDVPRRYHRTGRHDRRFNGIGQLARSRRRPDLLLPDPRWWRGPAGTADRPERRPRHPAG